MHGSFKRLPPSFLTTSWTHSNRCKILHQFSHHVTTITSCMEPSHPRSSLLCKFCSSKHNHVMDSTGAGFLRNVIEDSNISDTVCILSRELFSPCSFCHECSTCTKCLALHHYYQSWNDWSSWLRSLDFCTMDPAVRKLQEFLETNWVILVIGLIVGITVIRFISKMRWRRREKLYFCVLFAVFCFCTLQIVSAVSLIFIPVDT